MKIEEMILKNFSQLNETDLIIWNYVSNNILECSKISLDDLSKKCNVSRTTVTRFVKKIGLDGYSEFKVRLSMENKNSNSVEIDDNHFGYACDSIINYVSDQKKKNYDTISKMIFEAKNVFSYGTGDIQNDVSRQMKRMFLTRNKMIYNIEGVTFDEATYDIVQPDDVMIIISLSGSSDKVLNIAKRLKLKGVKIITITEFKDNRLSQLSDESLYINSVGLSIIDSRVPFKMTMMYFVLIEFMFIKYCIYTKQ